MLNVRRLAAVDMHGVAGTRRRQSIVGAEFFAGAVGGASLGIWIAVAGTTVGWQLFGAWIAGIGVNYAALAWQAVLLWGPGALKAELAGVDLGRELRGTAICSCGSWCRFSLRSWRFGGRAERMLDCAAADADAPWRAVPCPDLDSNLLARPIKEPSCRTSP